MCEKSIFCRYLLVVGLLHEEVDVNFVLSSHGDPPTPHPSYFSPIDGAWRSPRAPLVVLFSHRCCVAIPPTPHPSYFPLIDSAWQAHRASSSVLLLHQ